MICFLDDGLSKIQGMLASLNVQQSVKAYGWSNAPTKFQAFWLLYIPLQRHVG
jgi:hypothetical protein